MKIAVDSDNRWLATGEDITLEDALEGLPVGARMPETIYIYEVVGEVRHTQDGTGYVQEGDGG